jgi:hypothetical protein
MATPLGTAVVTSIARRYIMPEVVDTVYASNPITFRMLRSNRRVVRGGTQIEVPLMYARFSTGGFYSGLDLLNVAPADTVKNAAFDWAQAYTNVTVDGLTLIKTDSPESIANFLQLYFEQARMEMAEILATGIWSDGSSSTSIVGLKGAIDDGGVLATYGGLLRSSNTWWKGKIDSSTATLALDKLQSMFTTCMAGGRQPTLITSRVEQYNRYWNLLIAKQNWQLNPTAYDTLLADAGWHNLLFNGIPWVVDSHVFDGPSSSNSAIVFLNEEHMQLVVSPRADFYLEEFQSPINQDAMAAKMLWAGQLILNNPARFGKMTNVSA